jgi:ADP-ribose pyrophosphatase YjhB (NUDIX family)
MELKRYSGVLIRCKDEVLLCQRSFNEDSRPGEWSIPCGHQEKNENKLICAVRELYEETKIRVNPNDLQYVGGIKTFDDFENHKGILSIFVLDSDKKMYPDLQNAKDGKEHEDCGYFTINNLPSPLGSGLLEIINKMLFKSI